MTDIEAPWETRSLSSLASYLNGYAFKPRHWGKDGLPIVRIRELLDASIEPDRYEGVAAKPFRIDDGDLIFSWSATLAALFWSRGPAYLNQHLFKVTPASDVDIRFLHRLLNFHIDRLSARSHGTTMKHVTRSDLKEYQVRLPGLPTQHRIADILDALEGRTRASEAMSRKLGLLRVAVLEECLRRASTGRKPRKLSELTSRIVDGVHHTPMYTRVGVPFLTVENLTRTSEISLVPCRYVSERAHADYRRRIEPLPGDVLVSKDGTLGVARVVPAGFPTASVFVSIAVLRPIASELSASFLRLFFDTRDFQQQLGGLSAGSGLKHIHLEHFREFDIPNLDLAEQNGVVEAVERVDVLLMSERRVLSKLSQLKAGLTSDLMSGKIQVLTEKIA